MRFARLLLLSFLLLACNSPRAADSPDDLRAWQGTWNLISSTFDGEPQMADMQWVVEGDHYRVRYNQRLEEVPIKFTLDARESQG